LLHSLAAFPFVSRQFSTDEANEWLMESVGKIGKSEVGEDERERETFTAVLISIKQRTKLFNFRSTEEQGWSLGEWRETIDLKGLVVGIVFGSIETEEVGL
jgi:hypothetical protein